MATAPQAFKDRILNYLLPEFCDDPSRAHGRGGFKENWKHVTEKDAADFLLALDAGLIEHQGRGLYRAARTHGSGEQFFWTGLARISPRPLTLWVEPIITIAVLSRLHFQWGWPKDLIGTQSLKWEFDVTAYLPSDEINEYVACEVKKTDAELGKMLEYMQRFSRNGNELPVTAGEKNAYNKLKGLQERRAPVFWAVGPNGTSKVFRMTYKDAGTATFEAALDGALRYPG